MACVRLKRFLDEDPPEAITVSHKKRRISDVIPNVAGSSNEENVVYDEVKVVFKFAGTVKSKDESIDSHLSQAVVRDCKLTSRSWRSNKGPKSRVSKVESTRRRIEDAKAVSSDARSRLVCALRGVDLSELKAAPCDGRGDQACPLEATVNGLFKLYDAVEIGVEKDVSSKAVTTDEQQVTCNGITMTLEGTAAREAPARDYVYDLYYLQDTNVEFESQELPVLIEPCHLYGEQTFCDNAAGDDDSDPEADDEDDENEECNWRNDYPDEDDDFEKDYDYYRDYDCVEEDILQKLSAYNIDDDGAYTDEDSLPEYAVDSTDVTLHGETYAAYKAQMKAYVEDATDGSGGLFTNSKAGNKLV